MAPVRTLTLLFFAIPVFGVPQNRFSFGGSVSETPFNFGPSTINSQSTISTAENPFVFGSVTTPATSATTTYSVVTPKAPVITITVPGGYENQVLVGSLIGTASSLYTIAIACANGTNPNACDFNPPVTVTAGPSTYHYQVKYDNPYTFEAACSFSSAGGSCINTDVGAHSGSTPPSNGRQIATKTFDANYLTKVQVYITAGQTAGLTAASTVSSANGVPTLAPNAAAAGLLGLAALLL